MLQIRLSKQSAEPAGGLKPSPAESVTVACADHLVLADLPVAKGVGSAASASAFNTLGRRSRRLLGDRVHFCVRCDYPIAIYGRLSPCDHTFCLDCARSDSVCYLCDEVIQKIQTIKMMEGIFVCAAPHCLKSFLKMEDFTSHIHETHSELLHSSPLGEECNDPETQSVKLNGSELERRGATKPLISPTAITQTLESDDKSRRLVPLQRPMMPSKQPLFGQMAAFSGPPVTGPSMQDMTSHSLIPAQFGMVPFHQEGHPNYGHYEMPHVVRPETKPEPTGAQTSELGFLPGPVQSMNFMPNYPPPQPQPQPQQWISGTNSDSQGNGGFYHDQYGRAPTTGPMGSHPPLNKTMDALQPMDPRAVLPSQPYHHSLSHHQLPHRQRNYPNDNGQTFAWQHENRDGFVSGQD